MIDLELKDAQNKKIFVNAEIENLDKEFGSNEAEPDEEDLGEIQSQLSLNSKIDPESQIDER